MFGGGGGGLNPRKMQQMMEQMGIDVTELDAESVTITTSDGEEYVFDAPDVTRMDARGQETFQVVGDYETRQAGAGGAAGAVEAGEAAGEAAADEAGEAATEAGADEASGSAIPDADVEIVAERAGVTEADAREALAAVDGDLAAAVERLE
ncbi:MAG: nascent polypeptide-associated complex protein [Halobacteriaceae archaeon]